MISFLSFFFVVRFIQVLTPSSGFLDQAISMRPDYHEAIIDTIRHYGWEKIIYLYDSHDGKFLDLNKKIIFSKIMFRWSFLSFHNEKKKTCNSRYETNYKALNKRTTEKAQIYSQSIWFYGESIGTHFQSFWFFFRSLLNVHFNLPGQQRFPSSFVDCALPD